MRLGLGVNISINWLNEIMMFWTEEKTYIEFFNHGMQRLVYGLLHIKHISQMYAVFWATEKCHSYTD